MSAVLKGHLKDEWKAVGLKDTEMNDKMFTAISKAVFKYLNQNVQADITSGSSSGQYNLKAT